MTSKKKNDPVNHPPHYNKGKYEVLTIIADQLGAGYPDYLKGNILKYILRYEFKNGLEDLQKAEFYLKRLIKYYEYTEFIKPCTTTKK